MRAALRTYNRSDIQLDQGCSRQQHAIAATASKAMASMLEDLLERAEEQTRLGDRTKATALL